MVQPKMVFRIRSVWWMGVLFTLAFFSPFRLLRETSTAGQMPMGGSNHSLAVNYGEFPAIAEQDSTPSPRQTPLGKLSRRAKAGLKRISARETGGGESAVDTSRALLEAIRAMPRDSSARIAQFHYVRKDKPAVDTSYHKNHPMFLSTPAIVKYQVALDSNRQVYRLRQTVGDYDTHIPVEVPLEEYTSLRLKQTVRQNWESLAQAYQSLGEVKTTLGDIFGKITKIEVPVPKNPIFSIFGKNYIRMIINGAINIQAGFRNTDYDNISSNPLNQSRSEPSFKQEIQVNVQGEIGDKLKISADWNTQRTFEYENQLHMKYTGYEDEIVQSVEAGNVALSSPSSLIGSSSALFGIKALFQVGPLRLTTVATQKKGQTKELTASGGGQSQQIKRRPAEYSKNHYFVDTSYMSFYERLFQPTPDKTGMEKTKILEIEVWVSTIQRNPLKNRDAVAYMKTSEVKRVMNDPNARRKDSINTIVGEIERATFRKLDRSDFDWHEYAGIISLRSEPQPDEIVAVSYIIDGQGKPDTIGHTSQTPLDSLLLVLKLVKPSGLGPSTTPTAWKMTLKNRYFFAPGIDQIGFEFHVEYLPSGGSAVQEVTPQSINLMKMLGLDRHGPTGSETPADNLFDYDKWITIDEKRGEVIFPTLEPFDTLSIFNFFKKNGVEDTAAKAYADSFAYGAVYDVDPITAATDQRNRYTMYATVQGARDPSYRIDFNTVPGSVEVLVNGLPATPNVDYTVDYVSGLVTIKNPAYLTAAYNIQVKFETADMFQLASKSLLGARGEFNLGGKSSLGFTIMKYSKESLSEKVRLGEEPISNLILGVDGGTTIEAPWLTNTLNYIPGMKSTALSQISLRGEAAYMLPNPNTRRSPIPSDGDRGAAYIDDFEGARQTIPLGTTYAIWKDASPPWYIKNLDPLSTNINEQAYIPVTDSLIDYGILISDAEKIEYKARACWFNVIPSDVTIPQIWENKSYAAGQGQVMAMDFYFRPGVRGAFNYSMKLDSTIGLDNETSDSHRKAWAGCQHILGTTATNLVLQNISFIELWIKIVEGMDNQTKLNIDLGTISEDVIPNRSLDTEDGLGVADSQASGVLREGYDWGLDMINNSTEQASYSNFVNRYPNHPEYRADPSGDGWKRAPDGTGRLLDGNIAAQYDKVNEGAGGINGTEGNYESVDGHPPDTEDLDADGWVDLNNAYYEYEIPLDTSNGAFQNLVTGGGKNGWYQIRIPLGDYNRKIGNATLEDIRGVRLWVTGAQQPTLFRIVEFNLVGNQWEKRVKTDSSYDVGVVNIEDNPYYSSPGGLQRQKDLTRPDLNILGNEQSLSLIVKDLRDGEMKEVVKYMPQGHPLDMFNYRVLKMFVHGEEGIEVGKNYRPFKPGNSDAEIVFRFGDDILNYYEYRAPVDSGWAGNDVIINFADLTALKANRDSTTGIDSTDVIGGRPGAKYSVRGSPSLDNILFISIGIRNPANKGDSVITGELWVNELRLTDVDDTPGWAYKFDTNIKLADFGTIGFSFSETDPFFHRLEDAFNSTRSLMRFWSLSTAFVLDRLLPASWSGSSLSLNYSHSESINMPRYLPRQDVLVEKAAELIASNKSSNRLYKNAEDVRLQSEDLTVTDSYSIPNIKINIPLKTWLITETINKMSGGYSYSITRKRNPSTEFSKVWNWSAKFHYGTQFSQNNYVTPFSIFGDFFLLRPWKNFKIFFTPNQFNVDITLNRSQSKSRERRPNAAISMTHDLGAQRSFDFNWQFFEGGLLDLGIDYRVTVSSSLYHLDADRNGNLRPILEIFNQMILSDRLINFGIDLNYNQGIGFKTKLAAPQILKLDKIFSPNFSYSVNYSWVNNRENGDLGRNAGWNAGPSFSLNVDLKPISESIWPSAVTSMPADTGTGKGSLNPLKQLGEITRILIKYPFFDFERFSIDFSQSNTAQNNGVRGSTGFPNIFARVPFFQSSLPENGPSLLYQLGFASDPNGRVVVKTKSTFPFISGYTIPGIRASSPRGMAFDIKDIYTQNNQISLRTSRPLFEGVTLSLDWKVGWTYNETRSGKVDTLGHVELTTRNVSGDINRSYLSLPPVLIFKFFNTSIKNVNKKFEELKQQDPNDTKTKAATKMSQAFEEGLEAFPWLNKIIGPLVPRANWSIKWDGLEKFFLFKNFASRVSLDHAYSSSYSQNWQLDQVTGTQTTVSQSAGYKFSPLLGLSITFKEFIKGSLSASFRYGASTSYSLTPSNLDVGEESNSDYAASASYSRRGFEIPFLGVSLMNNIEIALGYNYTHSNSVRYKFTDFQEEGIPGKGEGRTTINSSITYTLSERVTAKLFYKYTRFKPDESGSPTPGSTLNEGGIDVNVAIR